MFPTYGEESEDDHTRAHHVGVGVLWAETYTLISSCHVQRRDLISTIEERGFHCI